MVYESKSRGIFKKEKKDILVGDYVDITVTDKNSNESIIERIYPRKNSLIRPNVVNIDNMIVVFSAKEPSFNYFLVDTFLATIQNAHIDVIIAINKIDLDEKKDYRKYQRLYEEVGYNTFAFSAIKGHGVEKIKSKIKKGITVISGPSGVGKSSFINAILGTDEQKTSQISTKLQKGKNTTTYASMIEISQDTYIVDTPGFTSIRFENLEKEDLKECFVEFWQFQKDCYFGSKCLHLHEPQCKVKEAVQKGMIQESRYKSYLKIVDEIDKKDKRRKYR